MKTFLRVLRYLRPYWWQFGLGLVCLVLAQPLELLNPLFWKYVVVDVLLGSHPRFIEIFNGSKIGLLTGVLAAMLLAQAMGTGLSTIRGLIHGVIANRLGFDLRSELYGKMQRLSMRFFHDSRSGDLVSRASGDVERVTRMVTEGVDTIVESSIQLLATWAIIFVLSWQVALSLVLPLVVVGLLTWRFNKRVRPIYRAARERLGDVSAKLQENILGIPIIKSFAQEDHEQRKVDHESRRYYDKSVEGVLANARFTPLVQIVGFTSNMVMLGVGGYFVMKGSFTIGGLVALRGYWFRLFMPIASLARVNDMIQNSVASADRVFHVMDHPREVEDAPDAVRLDGVEGRVAFENVSFSYGRGLDGVLSGVDVRVEPGQMLGVAGPSGAGKSTLLWLLMRFYDPQGGRILIDGLDLRQVTQASLRRQMALVSQEAFLFNTTIRENILFGRLDATDEAVHEAARQANVHEFILSLPEGYDTIVGERGVKLSGGQKQRICIARAFLANPRVLLLDEATASVEPESEALIQAAVEGLMLGRTAVVISHRLSMVRNAHQILIIENGRVTEQGTHDELMALGGWYARMYRMQMGEESLVG